MPVKTSPFSLAKTGIGGRRKIQNFKTSYSLFVLFKVEIENSPLLCNSVILTYEELCLEPGKRLGYSISPYGYLRGIVLVI